tara:strand:+ start:13045 stop:13320 length:276 start_codon:yes stop_codon:yes gene_type:complete
VKAYELAALQIPKFHICLDKDHLNSSQLFVKNKIAVYLGIYINLDKKIPNKFIFDHKRFDFLLGHMRFNFKNSIGVKIIAFKLIFTFENIF